MNKLTSSYLLCFLGCFFATIVIAVGVSFFYLYQQASLLSNLITVNQHENYKIYVYYDKKIPTSDFESFCFGTKRGDIKAVIYIGNPNIFNTNGHNIGVIGKTNEMCNNDTLNKWETIVWKENGIEFGKGDFFLKKESLPSLMEE
ncbi:hypothetical protein S715_001087 [Salmonella enterica subsp. enterica]|nr:hypothetical protein [Salmonella enterica subsp. enterica]